MHYFFTADNLGSSFTFFMIIIINSNNSEKTDMLVNFTFRNKERQKNIIFFAIISCL